jgi:hypothetical protein
MVKGRIYSCLLGNKFNLSNRVISDFLRSWFPKIQSSKKKIRNNINVSLLGNICNIRLLFKSNNGHANVYQLSKTI